MPTEVKCICGHDIMLHGHYNMGCSVILGSGTDQHKCQCGKFERA